MSGIGVLTELEYLDLASNNIQTIPAEIGNLTKLETFNLSTNSITSLPSEIGKLNNVKFTKFES